MKKFTLFAAALAMVGFASNAAVVWEGQFDPEAWGETLEVSETAFAGLQAGDKITFNFTNVSTDPEAPGQIQIALKTVADWTWTEAVKSANIEGNSYTYTVEDAIVGDADDTDLEMILAHGINLKGQNYILTSIEVGASEGGDNPGGDVTPDTPDTPDTPTEGKTVWEGQFDPEGWGEVLEIPETAFAGLKEGDKIIFNFTNVSTDPEAPGQIQIALKTVADWTWTEAVKSANIEGNSYTYTVEDAIVGDADDTDLEMILAHGINLKGQNYILTSVQIGGAAQGGVNGIEMDAAAAPAEYYNLQGIRVANPENGIFIVRQGNKVMKIAK